MRLKGEGTSTLSEDGGGARANHCADVADLQRDPAQGAFGPREAQPSSDAMMLACGKTSTGRPWSRDGPPVVDAQVGGRLVVDPQQPVPAFEISLRRLARGERSPRAIHKPVDPNPHQGTRSIAVAGPGRGLAPDTDLLVQDLQGHGKRECVYTPRPSRSRRTPVHASGARARRKEGGWARAGTEVAVEFVQRAHRGGVGGIHALGDERRQRLDLVVHDRPFVACRRNRRPRAHGPTHPLSCRCR